MQLAFQRASNTPLYQQLAEQIRKYIRSGALSSGARLPTVRQLASEYGLTRLTVHSAYTELQAEGLVEAIVGRGTFVASEPPIPTGMRISTVRVQPPPAWLSQGVLADMMRMAGHDELISFAQLAPPVEAYPGTDFSRSLRAVMDDPAALGYGSPQGEAVLRTEVARLLLDRGIVTAPEQILITAGGQQGIDLTLRSFTTPDNVVLVEEPTYVGMIELAAQRGQRLVGIPLDEQGIRLDALEAACKLYRPRLLYLIPTFHNPTGHTLSAERRQGVLRLANKYDLLILEDDIVGLLAYDGPPPTALKADDQDGRVLSMLSFSKIVLPTLRLAAMVVPAQYLPTLLAVKRSSDLLCSPLSQHALADYLRRNHLQSHLQRTRQLYRERRDTMLAALEQYLPDSHWTSPAGGLCIWVTLPAQLHERDLYLQAIERGVGIAPGSAFFAVPQAQPYMRLGFGAHPPAQIRLGITRLGKLIQEQLRQQAWLVSRAGNETSLFL
jgi:2-aminoadipate transaminase